MKNPERIYGKNQHTTVEPWLLDEIGINIIFDVGACRGEYARYMYEIGYSNKIVSFEPVLAAYNVMLRNKRVMINNGLKNIKMKYFEPDEWIIAPKMALGEINGPCTINVSKNYVASSLLDNYLINDIDHETDFVRKEETTMNTLDDVYDNYVNIADVPFLKMDVQGYEFNVLRGGEKVLSNFLGIQFECSLCELYKGEVLWKDIIEYLEARNFVVYDIIRGWFDTKSKRLLQIDVIMLRKDVYDNLVVKFQTDHNNQNNPIEINQ